ncbi:receptor/non-receptor type protein-tyrosine phosphatase [Violaceomyces palustris]|uniref:Receptor/non-receptor type protein-tyrosine phosphatase n=1 Tax=Violaceomyces palustris TaxID=1673888 RepID=A0ACD0NNX6_9BASI|nr:receptor/non-receptor type protein-tyrosine phosphatase [Violaceomyces palustris]
MSKPKRPSAQSLAQIFGELERVDRIRSVCPDLGFTTQVSRCEEVQRRSLNRYCDVLAYDHSLLPTAAARGGRYYLNANLIPPFPFRSPPGPCYIASQAPLAHTLNEFYHHVCEQGVKVLVNLTPLVEGKKVKSDRYWPDAGLPSQHAGHELSQGGKVELVSEEVVNKGELVIRRLKVHRPKSRDVEAEQTEPHRFTQVHVSSWPDHGTFPIALFKELLLKEWERRSRRRKGSPPIWVHCSAGIGRSGTFIAAHMARSILRSYDDGSIMQLLDLPTRLVQHMRMYRPRMVQTFEQFLALWEMVEDLKGDGDQIRGERMRGT